MNQYSRIPIVAAQHLSGNEYKLLDYLLYRHALDNWKFRIKDIIIQTGCSRCTVLRGMKFFLSKQFVTHHNQRRYSVNYPAIDAWIESLKLIPKKVSKRDIIKSQNDTYTGKSYRKELKERIESTNVVSTNSGTNFEKLGSDTTPLRSSGVPPIEKNSYSHDLMEMAKNGPLGDQFMSLFQHGGTP